MTLKQLFYCTNQTSFNCHFHLVKNYIHDIAIVFTITMIHIKLKLNFSTGNKIHLQKNMYVSINLTYS